MIQSVNRRLNNHLTLHNDNGFSEYSQSDKSLRIVLILTDVSIRSIIMSPLCSQCHYRGDLHTHQTVYSWHSLHVLTARKRSCVRDSFHRCLFVILFGGPHVTITYDAFRHWTSKYQTGDLPPPLETKNGTTPPPRYQTWHPSSYYRHLVVITGDLFKLVHLRTYPTPTPSPATGTDIYWWPSKSVLLRAVRYRILLECILVWSMCFTQM